MQKREYSFKLSSISLVKDFVNLTDEIEGDVSIYSGRYVIDGKSIMGIFSLDLTRDLKCIIEGSTEDIDIFEAGLKRMKLI